MQVCRRRNADELLQKVKVHPVDYGHARYNLQPFIGLQCGCVFEQKYKVHKETKIFKRYVQRIPNLECRRIQNLVKHGVSLDSFRFQTRYIYLLM